MSIIKRLEITQKNYILFFSFFDMKHFLDINQKAGITSTRLARLSMRRWRWTSRGSGIG